jgi:hypothetical protein
LFEPPQAIGEAQQQLRRISPRQHGELVSALQAKLLALQGRGGDSEIAHVTPGEMVIPRNLQMPEVMRTLAAEAMRAGIDPRRYTVGHRANSLNPRTGRPEFAIEEIVVTHPGYGNTRPRFITRGSPFERVGQPSDELATDNLLKIAETEGYLNPACSCPYSAGQVSSVNLARINSLGERYPSALCGWISL